MKKIYFVLSALILFNYSHAQLTLTQAANEPAIGESVTKKGYDSVGVVPKNTGAGLNWNFSAYTQNTVTAVNSYSNTSSVPGSSLFPAATLVEHSATGDKLMWKSASTPTTQFELLGIYNSLGVELNLSSNSAIAAIWPTAFNSTVTDTGSGTVSVSSNTGIVTNTLITIGAGTGTIVLPGNVPFSNILQVKSTQTLYIVVGTGSSSLTILNWSTDYNYYHSSQKFPLVTVNYEKETQTSILGPTVTTTAKISMNNAVFTGLNDKNFDATFQIFPNPAKDQFQVSLTNNSRENGSMDIYNSIGQLVSHIELGNEPSIQKTIYLNPYKRGIYFVKTSLGNRSSTRKLIIE